MFNKITSLRDFIFGRPKADDPYYLEITKILHFLQRLNCHPTQEMLTASVDFMGEASEIIEITGKPETISDLIGENTISFRLENMPCDMERMLKQSGFFEHIAENVQRIVLCPHIHNYEISAGGERIKRKEDTAGMAINGHWRDEFLYPGESVIFLTTGYTENMDKPLSLRAIILVAIHEAAHKKLARLADAAEIRSFYARYLELNERFAILHQIAFLEKMQSAEQNIFSESKEQLAELLSYYKDRVVYYNEMLGLYPSDETLLPIAVRKSVFAKHLAELEEN